MKFSFLFCFLSLAVALPSRSQTSSFDITYNGFTPEAQTAFQFAADKWSHILVSAVPIKVNAHFVALLPGMLGITLPNGRRDFTGAPMANTWYAASLANSITGAELNPGESDFDLYLNASVAWHYDTMGAVPSGKYYLVSVAMHELCHGFGFISLAKKAGTSGSFGMLQPSDFFPITTSFPWPDLDTLPSAFDRFLEKNTGAKLDTFENPGTALGDAITSSNVYFNGAHATAANNGIRPRIYAPSSFEIGSSISHFNESTYPAGNANEMMTPNGTPGNANHQPGTLALGALRDIGWTLNPEALTTTAVAATRPFYVFPNPASEKLFLTDNGNDQTINVFVTDATGRVVMPVHSIATDESLNVAALSAGFYFVVRESGKTTERASFVKH